MPETSFRDSDRGREISPSHNNLVIFTTDSKPYNLSYTEWTIKWWQWAMSIPQDKNPLIDKTGKYCAEGQNGPVWFLAGTSDKTHQAQRRCTIPNGKAILFPIIVSQFSFSEVPHITTDKELISHTAEDINRWSVLETTVDEIRLGHLDEYRIQSGPFELFVPDNNIWDIKPGPTKAASDGFWVFLGPLSDGNHTIRFHGIEPNYETAVTYNLTIVT